MRYVLVARSPAGVENVSFEGMRCVTNEYRIYAARPRRRVGRAADRLAVDRRAHRDALASRALAQLLLPAARADHQRERGRASRCARAGIPLEPRGRSLGSALVRRCPVNIVIDGPRHRLGGDRPGARDRRAADRHLLSADARHCGVRRGARRRGLDSSFRRRRSSPRWSAARAATACTSTARTTARSRWRRSMPACRRASRAGSTPAARLARVRYRGASWDARVEGRPRRIAARGRRCMCWPPTATRCSVAKNRPA